MVNDFAVWMARTEPAREATEHQFHDEAVFGDETVTVG